MHDFREIFLWCRSGLRMHVPFKCRQHKALARQILVGRNRNIGRQAVVLKAHFGRQFRDFGAMNFELARRRRESAPRDAIDHHADGFFFAIFVGAINDLSLFVDARALQLIGLDRLIKNFFAFR